MASGASVVLALRPSDRDRLAEYYAGKLQQYGDDPRSLGWTPGGSRLRFGALAGIGDLAGRSVLDVGCGFGDFYGYLLERGACVDYTGVDINADLIAIAKGKYPGARFTVADFEERGADGAYDWAFAAGLFTIRLADNPAFVGNVLKRMFDGCRLGFAADFLRPTFGDGATDPYWRPQPEEIVGICRALSRRLVLRCDYMADEFCVYVYKNDMADERNAFEDYCANHQ